jgi:hypothetical protein
MSTPDFVKFSRVPGTIEDALKRIELRTFSQFGLEYDSVGAMRPDDDPWTGGFSSADESVPSRSRVEALSLARKWTAWGLSFLVRQVPGYFNLEFFHIENDSFAVAASFDTSMLTFESDQFAKGQWLRGLFIGVVAALGCQVCGYGHDAAYEGGYESLSPSRILERLRAGELFTMRFPNFHAISVDLVSTDEMTALWERLPRSQFLKYGLATTGYHILSIIP